MIAEDSARRGMTNKKEKMKSFFKTIVFITIILLGQGALAHPVKVTNLRFAIESDKARLVFNATAPIVYAVTATQEKIIIDIKKASGSRGLIDSIRRGMIKGNPIDSMSSTQHGDNLRLVLKLKEPVTLKNFLLSKPNRLVLDLVKTGSRGLVNNTGRGITEEDNTRREMIEEKNIQREMAAEDNFRREMKKENGRKNGENSEKENESQPQVVSDIGVNKSEVSDILENMERDLIDKMSMNNSPDISVKEDILNKEENVLSKNEEKGSRDIVIVIDPGHGGKDPGAIGFNGTREKDVTLAVAKYLQNIVNGTKGFRAILTRNSDYFIPLRGRLGIAHKHKADMFISIHADAYKNNTAHGASIFALSQRGATSEAARWLAEKENESELGQVISDKSALLRSVLIDLAQTATTGASLEIGNTALQGLSTIASLHSKHVEQAAFVVLKSPDIPSLLVEVGFLSHSQEESKLRTSSYQEEIAAKLAMGIKSYFMRRPPSGTHLAKIKRKANYNLGMVSF